MIRNVSEQAWPISRLEWILVDDGGLDDLIPLLQEKMPALVIRHVTMDPEATIGAKRNAGVKAAGVDVSLFMMMDDDDHYPRDSVAIRASWLTKTPIVYCATLPMYDVRRYISAINVPPLTDPPDARVSEATLGFTRAAWEAQPFPEVSMAEGEQFLKGRVQESTEIPAGGVIVSFIHSGNTSSRRIPADQEPNGCHYGLPDDYFRYLHQIGS
jgi:glycosyltransferase involved in cell wall biosynthesis